MTDGVEPYWSALFGWPGAASFHSLLRHLRLLLMVISLFGSTFRDSLYGFSHFDFLLQRGIAWTPARKRLPIRQTIVYLHSAFSEKQQQKHMFKPTLHAY
jgi:hypothetical protein